QPARRAEHLKSMRARLIAAALALMLTAVVADAAVLTPDHVVIVIEENLPTRELAPELAYLNSLLHQGANFTNSHGIDHPSQPNYLALFSGDPQGTESDAKRNHGLLLMPRVGPW